MKDNQQEKPVSPQKLEANRANAKRSTGPRTSAGKQRASQNSYQHGFYGKHLFPSNELMARDGADYNRIYAAYWNHYAPVGDLEKYCVERIAVESLRLTRLLGHEQKVLSWSVPFEQRSMDRIVRYETSINHQLEKEIERLERLQEARLAESNQSESSDGESDTATSNPDEPTEKTSEAPKDQILEPPQHFGTPTTTAPHVETSAKQGVAHTDGEPSKKPAGITANNPPPAEECHPKAGMQNLAKIVDQAMNAAPAE